jgi:hypothetical protein
MQSADFTCSAGDSPLDLFQIGTRFAFILLCFNHREYHRVVSYRFHHQGADNVGRWHFSFKSDTQSV